jgi:chromosome segregation ATPase
LKQVTASSVTDFIQDELKKASESFVNEKNEKDNAIKAAQEKYEVLSTESEKVKEELEKLKSALAKLEEEKAAKAQEEAFNLRMASLDEEFDLSDEDRQVLAADVKDLNNETFAAYKNKMAILMKEKNKAAKKAKMDKEDLKDKGVDEDKEDKNGKMIKSSLASTEVSQTLSATEVVDEVLDNSNIERNSIPNSTTTAEVSLREKYSKAFGLEEFDIK